MSSGRTRSLSTASVWVLVFLTLLWVPWDNQWIAPPTIVEGNRVTVLGTPGQEVSEEPSSQSSSLVLFNSTPFSPDPDWRQYPWNRTERGGRLSRYFNIAFLNLTELLFTCKLSVQDDATNPTVVVLYGVYDEQGRWESLDLDQDNATEEGRTGTTGLTLEAPLDDLRSSTSSSVIAALVEIHTDGILGEDLEILGFSVEAVCNAAVCPVTFDIRHVDGQSFYLNPTMKWLESPGPLVRITREENGLTLVFIPSKANDTLYLWPGNYSGDCRWPSAPTQHAVLIEASVRMDFSTTWLILVSSVEIHLDVVPRVPGCEISVRTGEGQFYTLSQGSESCFMPPNVHVWIYARMTQVLASDRPNSAYDGEVVAPSEIDFTTGDDEQIYIRVMFSLTSIGSMAVQPFTVFLLAFALVLAMYLLFMYQEGVHRILWRELLKTRGFIPFLFLLASLFVPWTSRTVLWSGPGTGQEWFLIEIPGLFCSVVWSEGSAGFLTPVLGFQMVTSLILWASLALVSIQSGSRAITAVLGGLSAACVGLGTAFADIILFDPVFGMPTELVLLDTSFPIIGPFLIVCAMVSWIITGHIQNTRKGKSEHAAPPAAISAEPSGSENKVGS